MKPLTQLVDQILARSEHDWQVKLRAEWSTIMGDLSRRARLSVSTALRLLLVSMIVTGCMSSMPFRESCCNG